MSDKEKERPKPVLKEYCDFVDLTLSKVNELQKRIDDLCQEIGCKSLKEEQNFMDCTSQCPLFYAWSFLDKMKQHIQGEEQK